MPLGPRGGAGLGEGLVADLASVRDTVPDPLEAIEFCFQQGWTDGLPVVPPTPERVAAWLAALGLPPETVVGALPERGLTISAEKLAANALMAGCRPEYLPLLVAAVRAVTASEFGLATALGQGGGAPLLIVNGPPRLALGLNARAGLFGPGVRANATIGRALSLLLRNLCASGPHLPAPAFSHPGGFTYCIAEDEEGTSWAPLHVERGLPGDAGAVTVVLAGAPRLVRTTSLASPEAVLLPIADALAATSHWESAHVVVIGPEHRAVLERAGWTKADVRAFLAEHGRRSLAGLKQAGLVAEPPQPGDAHRYPTRLRETDLVVLAGGGEGGPASVVVPPWLAGRVSEPVLCPVAVPATVPAPPVAAEG